MSCETCGATMQRKLAGHEDKFGMQWPTVWWCSACGTLYLKGEADKGERIWYSPNQCKEVGDEGVSSIRCRLREGHELPHVAWDENNIWCEWWKRDGNRRYIQARSSQERAGQ